MADLPSTIPHGISRAAAATVAIGRRAPESLERDYEAFRLGLPRRRVRRPTGFCDRVLLGNSRLPAFSATAGNFSCRNFDPAPPRPQSRGGGFVTIWVGNRFVWKGPEDEIPTRFRDGDDPVDP